jgi:hypothetical protein
MGECGEWGEWGVWGVWAKRRVGETAKRRNGDLRREALARF